jgi:integrase
MPLLPPTADIILPEHDDLGSLPFAQALRTFLAIRRPFLTPKTARDYVYASKRLIEFFAHTTPNEITSFQIIKYQLRRKDEVGPSWVNHECSLLQQLLKRCGLWERIGRGYNPLPLPREGPGRCIADDEEERLLRTGAANPLWEAAYLFALLSLNTTMGPGEVLSLRRKDIDLEKKTATVNPEGAKNANRVRLIPLEGPAFDVCKYALQRAEKKGSILPEHYVFPYRTFHGATYDPARHQTTLKTSWMQMLRYAGIKNLRMYDLRHTAITRLCEDPENSEETIESIAGHITHQMKKRYCHIRVEARRAALARLAPARVTAMQAANDGRANQNNGKAMNNQQVLDLVAAGLSADVIVAKIKRALANFDTEPQTLKTLKAAGVPNPVILAMVQA